ncbi:hypothetical protein [Streptomyces siamensis]
MRGDGQGGALDGARGRPPATARPGGVLVRGAFSGEAELRDDSGQA